MDRLLHKESPKAERRIQQILQINVKSETTKESTQRSAGDQKEKLSFPKVRRLTAAVIAKLLTNQTVIVDHQCCFPFKFAILHIPLTIIYLSVCLCSNKHSGVSNGPGINGGGSVVPVDAQRRSRAKNLDNDIDQF